MKKSFFYTIVFFLSMLNVHAQFIDNLESYTAGTPICNDVWGAESEHCLFPSSNQARTGTLSGYITNDGTSNTLLNLGNKVFGPWSLQFYIYIPSGNEALWNILGTNSVNLEESVVGNIYFNKDNGDPGVGYIDWGTVDVSDDTYFSFSHDTWFRVVVNVDISLGISAATWECGIDGVVVVDAGTPFADGNGVPPTSLGGINFVSTSAVSQFYFDDFCYESPFNGNVPVCFPLSTNEIEINEFIIYPNPVSDKLYIDNNSTSDIESIQVYDVLGKLVLEAEGNSNQLDISKLLSGVLFVKVATENGVLSEKVVKL